MCKRVGAAVIAFLFVILTGGVASADDPYRMVLSRVDAGDFPTIRFVASVVDGNGKAVPGLRPQDLRVREASRSVSAEVTLASLVSPVALALVVDTSGSMAGRPLSDAKAAVATMIRSLGPDDQVAVLSFSAAVRLAQPLTKNKDDALAAVGSLVAGGDTAIYDAVISAADVLAASDPRARRAVILLTDGLDTASRTSRESAAARLASDGLPLQAIGLGDSIDRTTLQTLAAAASGGASHVAPTSSELAAIYAGLSEQILTEYSVQYRSSSAGAPDGTTVSFDVTVSRGETVIARGSGSFAVPVGRGARSTTPASLAPQPIAAVVVPPVAARNPDTWVVGLLGAMTALMFVLWLYELTLFTRAGERRRVRALLSPDAEPDEAVRQPLLARIGRPARSLGRWAIRFLPARYVQQTRHRLELAGEPMSEAEFIGLRLGGTVGLSLMIGLVGLLASKSVPWTVVAFAVGAAAGFSLPGIVVGSIARRRRKAVQKALIPSLDMLALSAEAGLAFDGAIAQVVQRWRNPLSDELRRLLLQFQMGRDRKDALRELAQRTDVADVGKFVSAVIQADTLGVGLAKVLHDQAIELRTKRRQRAEEQARLAPIKMMFPMVLLIFPALFVVILGPAIPKMTEIFNVAR